MSWLRLPAVALLIIERGYAPNEADALVLMRPVISAGKLNLRGHQGDTRMRLPAKPPIDPNAGFRWLVSPQIDLATSTILIPNYSNERSWERLEGRPRPEVIEMESEDLDRIWPAPKAKLTRAGAPPQYDWEEAELYAMKQLQERGDPKEPRNQADGWRSQEDLCRLIIDYLAELDGNDGPDIQTVRPRAKKWLQIFRSRTTTGKQTV